MPKPWPPHHRRLIKARIDDVAKRARESLGAHDVLVVAWFQDILEPSFLHMQDGGTSPMPPHKVYRHLADTVDALVREADATDDGKPVIDIKPDTVQ